MRVVLRFGLVGLFCVGLAVAVVVGLTQPEISKTIQEMVDRQAREPVVEADETIAPEALDRALNSPPFPLFSTGGFESAGYPTAGRYMAPIADRSSLEEIQRAVSGRARRGIAELSAELNGIPRLAPDGGIRRLRTRAAIGYLSMYEGQFDEAAKWIELALTEGEGAGMPPGLRANLEALLGVIHLRRGETENCVACLGPSSCIFPIAEEAVHQFPSGSREAIDHFTSYLAQRPEDLGVRWLLNLAYMTLGEYPERVPPGLLVPLDRMGSKVDVGRFENVASKVGLGSRGPNMAGGSLFDDFNGDDWPDVLTTSFDADLGASLFLNRGDGTFDDHSETSGLASQPLAVNASQADFDNDGNLDVLMVRGGWETPFRLSLMRNQGDGTFEDVTVKAGLAEPIASHSGAWGDFDNDGFVDLFVCGEYAAAPEDGLFGGEGSLMVSDPRNRCRLYWNRGDGTFENVAEAAGVLNDRYAKGAAWGDYDDDGRLDLYVSNFGAGNRLYHNNGDGTFTDVAARLGVSQPISSFACWFWDFDNDGRLDLFVNDYQGDLYDVAASALGEPAHSTSHPRLYRNLGEEGFRDVSTEAGLDRIALAMGASFGDIDNDGFLDIYLATGLPGYSALMPNLLFKNESGRRFEDVTIASGTGHLQKGHGVSFADWDDDGDLDLFVESGGAVPGDRAFNLLFQNPGPKRHWLKVRLVGTRSNRAALGAKIRVDVKRADGTMRSIYRRVGGGSSYGGNSLVELIGLGDATEVASLTINWPSSGVSQTFHGLEADRTVEITEGSDALRVVAGRSGEMDD